MSINWNDLLIPSVSILELIARGSIMYVVLFALLRVLVRRHVGTMSLTDVLVLVLIADAAQNAMASEYRSLPEGIILCATIIAWSWLLDALSYRYDWLRRLLEPSPLLLVRNGKIQAQNMRLEFITKDELMSHLREQGIEHLNDVRTAYIESDGQISVIRADGKSNEGGPREHRAGIT